MISVHFAQSEIIDWSQKGLKVSELILKSLKLPSLLLCVFPFELLIPIDLRGEKKFVIVCIYCGFCYSSTYQGLSSLWSCLHD